MTRETAEWFVEGYYANDVKPPKQPGALAFETWHMSESSADVEVQAARMRKDIGQVEKIRRRS